jgi:hypothetical protein
MRSTSLPIELSSTIHLLNAIALRKHLAAKRRRNRMRGSSPHRLQVAEHRDVRAASSREYRNEAK